jgi:hypothetical protein
LFRGESGALSVVQEKIKLMGSVGIWWMFAMVFIFFSSLDFLTYFFILTKLYFITDRMKKNLFFRFIPLCFISFFFSFSFTLAVSIESFTTAIDQASTKKGSIANQISFLKTLEMLLQSSSFTSSDYKDIFAELSRYTTEKLRTLTQQGLTAP